jgi:hypothetical protein
MHERTMKPARSPGRPRRRIRRPAAPPHIARRSDDVAARQSAHVIDRPETLMEGGNGSGRGPVDDGRRRRPERPDGNDAGRLLIALGIVALGAGVMSARLLSQAGRRRR